MYRKNNLKFSLTVHGYRMYKESDLEMHPDATLPARFSEFIGKSQNLAMPFR